MAASARAYPCSCCVGRKRRAVNVRLTEAEYEHLRSAGMIRLYAAEHAPADLEGRPVIASCASWIAVGRKPGTGHWKKSPVGNPQAEPEIRFCPTCRRETIASDAGTCLWCSTSLVEAAEVAA